ncbi:hypothetical protein JW960_00280, partial [candidate division KSB1 bacterium]|nr:hypothetical protein [candidate division KSB1 bacterium]
IKMNLNGQITSLTEITAVAEKIANCKLDVQINQRSAEDKLMRALSRMISELISAVQNIQQVADEVANGGASRSQCAQEIFQGATEQAAAAEESSASMEEMSSIAQELSAQADGLQTAVGFFNLETYGGVRKVRRVPERDETTKQMPHSITNRKLNRTVNQSVYIWICVILMYPQ